MWLLKIVAVALDLASTGGGGGVTTAVFIVEEMGVMVTAELTLGGRGVGADVAEGVATEGLETEGVATEGLETDGVATTGLAGPEGVCCIKFWGGSGINPLKLAKISATLRRSV